MAKPTRAIKLGDEVEDVVSKVRGIAHGHLKYLDGTEYWMIQPAWLENTEGASDVRASAAYCRRIGDGVYLTSKPLMGFNVNELQE